MKQWFLTIFGVVSILLPALLLAQKPAEEKIVIVNKMPVDNNLVVGFLANPKNPFTTFLPKLQPAIPVVSAVLAPAAALVKPNVPAPVPPVLKLSGVVWGGEELKPQAIINGQIFGVGDTIKAARIVSITRSGVELLFNEQKMFLTVD